MTTIGAIAENKNIGAAVEVAIGANATRTSAAETEIVGDSVDRVPPIGGDDQPISHDSVVVLVALEGEIGAAETLTLPSRSRTRPRRSRAARPPTPSPRWTPTTSRPPPS